MSLARPAAVAGFCLASGVTSAHAQTAPYSIEWSAPAGCPSYADVASWLDAVLPPEVEARLERARASVTIEEAPVGGFSAVVRVEASAEGDERVRTLEGPSCAELARSAVIVVSVALTEAVSARQQPKPGPPVPAPAPAPAPPPPPAPKPAPRRPAPAPVPEAPRAVFGVTSGVTSGFGDATLRADVFARFAHFGSASVGARLRLVPLASVDTSQSDVDLLLAAASLGLCVGHSAAKDLEFGACLWPELGIVSARGGGPSGRDDSALWAALGAGPFVEWGERVRLHLGVDADVRLLRPTLELDGGQRVAQLPRFALAGMLGFCLAVP